MKMIANSNSLYARWRTKDERKNHYPACVAVGQAVGRSRTRLRPPCKADKEVPHQQGGPAGALAVAVECGVDLDNIETRHHRRFSRSPRTANNFCRVQTEDVRRTDAGYRSRIHRIGIDRDMHPRPRPQPRQFGGESLLQLPVTVLAPGD